MNNTATITGATGPGATVTALPFENVHSINFDFEANTVELVYGEPYKTFRISYDGAQTVTIVKTGLNTAITIS